MLSLVIERNSIIRRSIREQRNQDIVLPFTIKPSTNEQELIRILFKINSSKRIDCELHLFLTKIESLQSVLLKCLCRYGIYFVGRLSKSADDRIVVNRVTEEN